MASFSSFFPPQLTYKFWESLCNRSEKQLLWGLVLKMKKAMKSIGENSLEPVMNQKPCTASDFTRCSRDLWSNGPSLCQEHFHQPPRETDTQSFNPGRRWALARALRAEATDKWRMKSAAETSGASSIKCGSPRKGRTRVCVWVGGGDKQLYQDAELHSIWVVRIYP